MVKRQSGSTQMSVQYAVSVTASWQRRWMSPRDGSKYSPLLFPFGNQKAVHRHLKEAHVNAADRVIAEKWTKKQPAASQSRMCTLLGLDGASEGEEGTLIGWDLRFGI
ncbi:hypothetical protein DFH09DRAFT_1074665 [Mycena vulgaris]|nr:hypothetical protein DFH09DRAFT_1074665 [Mycena vulgaris]